MALESVSVTVMPDTEMEETVGSDATSDSEKSPGVAELSVTFSEIIRAITVPEVALVSMTVGAMPRVNANTDPKGTASVMNLTLSGDLPDTRPNLTLTYTKPNTGGITDGNNHLEGTTVTVGDGIAPTVIDTRATSGTVIALIISENVSLTFRPQDGCFRP